MFSLDSPVGFNGLPNMNRRLWTPRAVGAGLKLWLRGDLGIGQTGGVVDQWGDLSGNSNNYVSTLTARPAYTAVDATFANRSTLTWDGSNDVMTGPALSSLITVSDFTIFIVFSVVSISTNTANFEQNVALFADSGGLLNVYLRSTPTAGVYNWDGNRDTGTAAISLNTPTILTARHSGGNLGFRVNGGSEVTAASGNTTSLTGTTVLGRRGDAAAAFLNGKIAEMCILNTWPGEGVADIFRRYFSNRYQISL